MQSFASRILWQRTADFLKKYHPTLIGVLGGTGKTLTRQAIASALQLSHRVDTPRHAENSRDGVAAAILDIDFTPSLWRLLTTSLVHELSDTEPDTIVLEYGARKAGDIDYLSSKVPLEIAVVTNVESTHLDIFTSKDLVAHEYTSAVVGLPPEGCAVLNADDPLVAAMASKTPAHVLTFGASNEADVRLVRVERMHHHGFACEVHLRGAIYELHLPNLVTRRQIPSILAALAVASVSNVPIPAAIKALSELQPPAGRMRLLPGRQGSLLIDDSYNASPEDMLGSLEALRSIPGKRKIAILGDVLNLGGETQRWHKKIGKFAGEVASLVAIVGEHMRVAGIEAVLVGADVHHFGTSDEVAKWLGDFLQAGDVVLIKGARDLHMEEVTKSLLANPEQDADKVL